MNFPNLLTLSRIPFLFAIAILLASDWPGTATFAFVLFVVAALTDWADGYFARRWRLVSDFGKLMDALTDKILMVGLFVSLAVLGFFRDWSLLALFLVLLILCREFFITGLRLVAAAKGVVLAAEKAGKQKTVSQIVALCFLIGAPVVGTDLAALTGFDLSLAADWLHWIGFFLFLAAAILTVTSGTRYVMKYWNKLCAGEPPG
jgi:CDP-diacylglycerol---glycerol-3-phosphate 3-phosphatidyltransferase